MIYLIAYRWGSLLPLSRQFGVRADDRAGMQTGLLYFANILGSAAGAILIGFVLTNFLTLVQIALVLVIAGTICALSLIAMLDVAGPERLKRATVAVGVLVIAVIAIPALSNRVLENLLFKATADHAFSHVVENRSGIITVDTDGTVYGNGMYDGRFNTRLQDDRNGIIRPYALSLIPRRAARRSDDRAVVRFMGAGDREQSRRGLAHDSRDQSGISDLDRTAARGGLGPAQPESHHHHRRRPALVEPSSRQALRRDRVETRPGFFAPISRTCCRSNSLNLQNSTSIHTESCSTTPPIPTACSEPPA